MAGHVFAAISALAGAVHLRFRHGQQPKPAQPRYNLISVPPAGINEMLRNGLVVKPVKETSWKRRFQCATVECN